MTNLFSRFSIKAALIASALCIVAGQGAAFYLGVFSWPVAAASGVALLVLALGAVREAANAAVMRQGITCCEAVGRGDFESRIMARAPGDLGKLMLSTNDLIDRIDAFVREAEASMQFASQRKFFRRIIETGMMGAFLNASRTINAATSPANRAFTAMSANRSTSWSNRLTAA